MAIPDYLSSNMLAHEQPRSPSHDELLKSVQAPQKARAHHHSRSRTVSHHKDYIESPTSATGQNGGTIDQYYPTDLLEPTAPLRPKSAGPMLFTPPVDSSTDISMMKNLSKKLAGVDIDKVFHDTTSSEYGAADSEAVVSSSDDEEHEDDLVRVGHNQGRNKSQYFEEGNSTTNGQKYSTTMQNVKQSIPREMESETGFFDFKVPEFRDSANILTPSARHITMNRTAEMQDLITPLPDQR